MDAWLRLTVRMARMLRQGRVSRQQIIIWGVVVAAALAIALIEWAGYWPESLTVDRDGSRLRGGHLR